MSVWAKDEDMQLVDEVLARVSSALTREAESGAFFIPSTNRTDQEAVAMSPPTPRSLLWGSVNPTRYRSAMQLREHQRCFMAATAMGIQATVIHRGAT